MRITIVPHDGDWSRRFEDERAKIMLALEGAAHSIEHIGSTAVAGLAAKPIVDVMVTVDDVERESFYAPALEQCGYELAVREDGHRMFRTPERDVHVHVWTAGSEDAIRQLIFRDWLRLYPPDRDRYERAKRELAEREWPSGNDYANAKDPIIHEIMARALAHSNNAMG